MALFLNEEEQVQPAKVEKVLSMNEAMQGMVDLALEMSTLNEALLIADYRVENQVKALNEAGSLDAAKEKAGNLAKRAGELLTNAGSKAKKTIMSLYASIKAFVTKWFDKAMAKVKSLKGAKVLVAKAAWDKAMVAVSALKGAVAAIGTDAFGAKMKAASDAMMEASAAKSGEKTEVKESVIAKGKSAADAVAAACQAAASAAEKGSDPKAKRAASGQAVQAANAASRLVHLITSLVAVKGGAAEA